MVFKTVEGKSKYGISVSSVNDPHLFDLEHFRARMSRYIDPVNPQNRIFFDALQFAYELHAGQRRKSGAPYISHPCAVAEILAREMRFRDPLLLAAALLHDVVEDIPSMRIEDIEERFGTVVAELVDGCTKLTRYHLDRAALKDLTHSKIFLSASRRLGVLIIKLADRLHNLRTLHYLNQARRQRISQETIEVYAPIAARFNIFPIKRELYHLALSNLYPRKSKKILQFVRDIRNSPEVAGIENTLRDIFSDNPFPVTVRTRAKGLASYFDPLKRTLEISNAESSIDFAVVVDSDSPLDCYTVLGKINSRFTPIPKSIRDFIGNPKNNGYRSLHVRIHEGGQNILIKIRTAEMDHWSSFGVLGDWDARKPLSDEHWMEISELLKTIGEYGGAAPQRKAMIRLSETEEIFIYSPLGDIYYLPKGSIVLDFAYRIHSELGDHCQGAVINGDWSPVTRQLKDGDTVEILTSSEPLDVDPEFEELCKTPRARTAINRHLYQRRIQNAEDVGRQVLRQELQRHGLSFEILETENSDFMLEFLNVKDLAELFIRVGQDRMVPHLVLYYLGNPDKQKGGVPDQLQPPEHQKNVVTVSMLDKAIHKFARCCNPYPGQNQVVATTSERGMTFHHEDCEDLHFRHALQPQQLLEVHWDENTAWPHALVFNIQVQNTDLSGLIPSLAGTENVLELLCMESRLERNDQHLAKIEVAFRSFSQARTFFKAMSGFFTVVEDYGRKGSVRMGQIGAFSNSSQVV